VKCIVVVDDRKMSDDENRGEGRNVGDNKELFDDRKLYEDRSSSRRSYSITRMFSIRRLLFEDRKSVRRHNTYLTRRKGLCKIDTRSTGPGRVGLMRGLVG
jgi:hypothetical protein